MCCRSRTRQGAVRQACTKTFLVSPFLPMGLRYEFHVSAPGETLTVAIRASGPDGVVLRAALAGERRELTDAALMNAGLAAPLEAMKTTAAIHWEALRLWAKGVAYLGREGPPNKKPPEGGSSIQRDDLDQAAISAGFDFRR